MSGYSINLAYIRQSISNDCINFSYKPEDFDKIMAIIAVVRDTKLESLDDHELEESYFDIWNTVKDTKVESLSGHELEESYSDAWNELENKYRDALTAELVALGVDDSAEVANSTVLNSIPESMEDYVCNGYIVSIFGAADIASSGSPEELAEIQWGDDIERVKEKAQEIFDEINGE